MRPQLQIRAARRRLHPPGAVTRTYGAPRTPVAEPSDPPLLTQTPPPAFDVVAVGGGKQLDPTDPGNCSANACTAPFGACFTSHTVNDDVRCCGHTTSL